MGFFSVYDSVKKAIQDVVSPEIEGIKAQIQAVHSEIRRLDEKIDALDKKLDLAIQIHDRLARVEAKLGLT